MGVIATIKGWFGAGSEPKETKRRIPAPQARYDNARTGSANVEHWAAADHLSPNAAANAQDRKILRERARYEVANNSFAAGAANAIADDTIGTGPRLSIEFDNDATETTEESAQIEAFMEKAARAIEDSFGQWSTETRLADELRLMIRSGAVDGEVFALLAGNPKLRHSVQLNLKSFEADRVTDPHYFPSKDPTVVDGITFDKWGNPSKYIVLKEHPGERLVYAPQEYDTYSADQIFHWFRKDRPGQARGVSWFTPSLGLFAQLRRYTTATLRTAEAAARVAGVLETQLDFPQEEDAGVEAMDVVPLPEDGLVTLPANMKMSQLKPEQPVAIFGEFRTQILIEIARSLHMPLNRLTGNSVGYNYSSGRLDHLSYRDFIWVLRSLVEAIIMDRLGRSWLDEASLVGIIPDGLPPLAEWRLSWNWDAFEFIDPQVEADAAATLLGLNLTTLAELCAARGTKCWTSPRKTDTSSRRIGRLELRWGNVPQG